MVKFQCPRCAGEFNTKHNYKRHTKNINICKIKLQDIIPMVDNYIELDISFSCEDCGKEYEHYYHYTDHIDLCKDKKNKEQSLREQVEMLQEQLEYCGKKLSFKHDLPVHYKTCKEKPKEEIKEEIKESTEETEYKTVDKSNNNVKLSSIKNFNEFTNCIYPLSENLKGYIFEFLCKCVLLYNDKNITNIWLYKEIPKPIKKELKISNIDKGYDMLVEYDDYYKIVQCKFRSNVLKKVNYSDLSSFVGQITLTNCNGIFMTNTTHNCKEIENCTTIEKYNNDFFKDLNKDFFDYFRYKILVAKIEGNNTDLKYVYYFNGNK
jgi:hypothetical protein